jgi:hypothetical protein
MRTVATILLALALTLPVVATAAKRPAQGSLSIEGGRGVITIKGQGGVLGKIRGAVQIVDLSPNDKWRPMVNGVRQDRTGWVRGSEVSFRILGGKFKIQLRGEAISVAVRGIGFATFKGEPGSLGETGVYASGESADCVAEPDLCEPVPVETTKVTFGPTEPVEPADADPDKARPAQ